MATAVVATCWLGNVRTTLSSHTRLENALLICQEALHLHLRAKEEDPVLRSRQGQEQDLVECLQVVVLSLSVLAIPPSPSRSRSSVWRVGCSMEKRRVCG